MLLAGPHVESAQADACASGAVEVTERSAGRAGGRVVDAALTGREQQQVRFKDWFLLFIQGVYVYTQSALNLQRKL